MKTKYTLIAITLLVIVVLYSGCRRATPHDAYLPDPDCKKMGYYSPNYTHYQGGNFIYSIYDTLSADKTIRLISANFSGYNEAVVMVYSDTTGELIVSSGPMEVSNGWNKFSIPATMLPAGDYRLAVQVRYTSSGIRLESGAGTAYWNSNSWGNIPPSLGAGNFMDYAMLIYAEYCD